MELMKNSIAMTVTLISFAMLFATMFLGYFLVRSNVPVWPPVEIQALPRLLPLLSTVIMALSSVTYYYFEKKLLNGKAYLGLTLALGLVFLGLQWNLWSALKAAGILVSNGMVPSMVYAFTWIHAGHIVLGLLALLWMGWIVTMKPEKLSVFKVINVGKFWHFLGIVWLLMYLMMFVL